MECKAVFGSNAALLPVISFHQRMFTNWSLFSVWLVTSPKLFFPLGQDLSVSSKKCIEEVCLWSTNVSNLSRDFICNSKYDGVIQVELNVGYICLFSFFVVFIFHWNIGTQSYCPNSANLNHYSIVLLSMVIAYLSVRPHF